MLAQAVDSEGFNRHMSHFETTWRELSPRLKGRLARRGVPAWLVDDIAQETGLRLFKMWDRVDPERSLWGLTLTIANNLLWDERNRGAFREIVCEVPETAIPHDVETTGLARMQWQEVQKLMTELSPDHRSVLLAEIGEAESPASPSPDALKMLRMRARKRLQLLMQSASAFSFATWFELKEATRRFNEFLRRNGITPEIQAATTTAGFVVAVVIAASPVPVFGSEAREGFGIQGTPLEVTLVAGTDTAARNADDLPTLFTRSGSQPNNHREGSEPASDYDVTFGEDGDPARGGATLKVQPDDDGFQPSAPECEHQADAEEMQASAHCTVETPAGGLDAGTGVDINP